MGESTILEKIINAIKHIVFAVTTPLWVWSIGFKTLDEYIDAVVENRRQQEQSEHLSETRHP